MKRYIKANDYDIDSFDNIDDEYVDRPEGYTYWNILWVTFDGRESGGGVWVPDGEDEWWYADQILKRDYPEEYDGGEIIDVIDEFAGDAEFRDEWLENYPNLIDVREYIARHGADSFINASNALDDSEAVIEPEPDDYIQSSMSEEEQLNWAIENGKPFDLATFNKYKVDPYREPDALQAKDIQIGDFIRVTESADEVDLNTIVEIYDIDYNDPDGYNFLHNGYRTADDDVITFICKDRRGKRMPYNLHFWPDEYVGVKIGHQAKLDPNDFIGSAVDTSTSDHHMEWNESWRPYSGSESVYQTLYVDGKEVGYIESYDIDGQHETIAFIKSDPTEYEESLGTFRSEADAKDRLESEIRRTYDLIDTFPVTSATAEDVDDECINSGSCVNCESNIIKRYSDVRPYEDRRYWYFTTHGIGPGTIPEDLNVLETREGQNDKGTWGTYVCLDGVLNTSELDYYDLRELAPQDINSAEAVEDDDEWSPFYGGTYRIEGKVGTAVTFDYDPKDAIKHWFMKQQSAPADVSISCKTRQQAIDLCKAATPELLENLMKRYPACPYKFDYLIDECKKQVENGCKSFYENDYGYGDTIHPFGVG